MSAAAAPRPLNNDSAIPTQMKDGALDGALANCTCNTGWPEASRITMPGRPASGEVTVLTAIGLPTECVNWAVSAGESARETISQPLTEAFGPWVAMGRTTTQDLSMKLAASEETP